MSFVADQAARAGSSASAGASAPALTSSANAERNASYKMRARPTPGAATVAVGEPGGPSRGRSSTTKGAAASFRIQGPTVLIEYAPQHLGGDATQHTHAMYRDPTNDYGASFLKKQ